MKSADGNPVLEFVFADNHLLAVNKPSGLAAQPDASGDPSLVEIVKERIRREYNKPGEVYMALLHRLDRPTSGIILLARTGKAAGRMADLFRKREVKKRYAALVECHAKPDTSHVLENYLAPRSNGGMRVVPRKERESKEARLAYRTLAISGDGARALLEIDLETGVKHQIRCQLAHAGLPVVGDFRYGPNGRPARPEPVAGGRAILLHAGKVAFVHPVKREQMEVTARPPGHWLPFLTAIPNGETALAAIGAS